MTKIALRNLKADNTITTILFSGLGITLFYLAFFKEINIRVSGASLGHAASSGFLCVLGTIMFIMATSKLINLLSLLKYGQLEIIMDKDDITFPVHQSFKGYNRFTISKDQLVQLRVIERQKNDFTIYFYNSQGFVLGNIAGNLIPLGKIKPAELANQIQKWVNAG